MGDLSHTQWANDVAAIRHALAAVQTVSALDRIDQEVARLGPTNPDEERGFRTLAAWAVFRQDQANHPPAVARLFGGPNTKRTYLFLATLTGEYRTVELWLAHWMEVYRERLVGYRSGDRLPALGVDVADQAMLQQLDQQQSTLPVGLREMPLRRAGVTLGGLPASVDRYPREQLARTIRALVEQPGYSTSDRSRLRKVVDWDRITRLVNTEDDIRTGLELIVSQLEDQFDPLSSSVARAKAAADRYDRSSVFDRMRLSTAMIASFAEQDADALARNGKQYLRDVVAPPSSASAAQVAVLARSPVTPDEIERLLTSMKLGADGTLTVVRPNDAIWQGKAPNATALSQAATGAKGALTTYTLYASAVAGYAQFVQLVDAPGSTITTNKQKLLVLFDRSVDWPERPDPPATRTAVAVGMVALLLSLRSMVKTAGELADKQSLTADDYVKVFSGLQAVANDVQGVVAAHHALGSPSSTSVASKNLKTAGKILGVLGIVASCLDYGLSLHKATNASSGLEAAGHAFAAGGAAIAGITTFASVLGRVPHPMAFAVSVLALGVAALSKAVLHAAAVAETEELLAMTAFSTRSQPRRRAIIAQSRGTTVDDQGFEAPWFAFLTGAGREDYGRQIGTLLGHMGAFGIEWDVSGRTADLNTTRKTKGFSFTGSAPNSTLARSVLPVGSELTLHDATHERLAAGHLGVSASNAPSELTGAPGAPALTSAAATVLGQEDEVAVGDDGFDLPVLLEAQLVLPTEAWPRSTEQRLADTPAPKARLIVRKRD